MAQAPFVIQPYLTSIALAYRNAASIADQVLPRIGVDRQLFKYFKYTREDAFTLWDTRVGRKGKVNEIDWSASEVPDETKDYGLDDTVPQADINNTRGANAGPIDPTARSTELLTDLIMLDREVRAANLVFNASSYAAGNQTTLSGTGQWSDFTNSNPIDAISQAMDSMLVRPNIGVLGRAVFTKVRQHPKVVAAAYPLGGNAVSGGKVTLQALAAILELDEIIVGDGWVNTAKKGQTSSLGRIWGKHAAFLYRNPNIQAATQGAMTFGFTAEWGTRVAGTIENDPDIGLRGGTRVRVGESVKELVCANDAGYFFQNAIA